MLLAMRIRAERRAGQLLRETKENGQRQKPGQAAGGDGNSRAGRPLMPKLSDYGISKDQSSEWQELARIPKK